MDNPMQQQMESIEQDFEDQMANAWKLVEKGDLTEQQYNDTYHRYTQE